MLVGFGGLQPVPTVFVGLVINDACDVRDEDRENTGRDTFRWICTDWVRCDGEMYSLAGDVDRLGHSDRHSETFRDRHVLEFDEHSDVRRERPVR